MISSVTITIPLRSKRDLRSVRQVYDDLVRFQYIAADGHAFGDYDDHALICGVLCYYKEGWQINKEPPFRKGLPRAIVSAVRVTMGRADLIDGEYCDTEVRDGLQLLCDPLGGMPSIRVERTGAYVAAHRLSLRKQTANTMWLWDAAYRSVYSMWILGSIHEKWARDQLRSSSSALNRRARSLAIAVAKDTGLKCTVVGGLI